MLLRIVGAILVATAFLPATSAADEVWVFPGQQLTVTLSPQVVEALTVLRPTLPEPIPSFSLSWSGKGRGGAATELELTLSLGQSVSAGRALVTFVDLEGTLTVDREGGREVWHVTQSNFRRFFARAEWTAELAKITLVLPVEFAREGAAAGDHLHALLLVPCRLSGSQLVCGNARHAFASMVEQEFPHQPRVEDVLPICRDEYENVAPAPPN